MRKRKKNKSKLERGILLSIGEMMILTEKVLRPEESVNTPQIKGRLPEINQVIRISSVIEHTENYQTCYMILWSLPNEKLVALKTVGFCFTGLCVKSTGYYLVKANLNTEFEFTKTNKPQSVRPPQG